MMLRTIVLAAVAAAPAFAQQPTPATTRADSSAARSDTTVRRDSISTAVVARLQPTADDGRAVDAEVRVALYDLLGDRPIPALARLERLARTNAPAATGTLRGRPDALFLLSQTQYRFGMDSAFRQTADAVLQAQARPRYAPLLNAQLVLSAYRAGDYPRAVRLAAANTDPATRALTAFVSGLASYQLRDLAGARAGFTAAQPAGGRLGRYAQYMNILTGIRGDTAAASAISDLEALAGTGNDAFSDQVRMTAAKLAYQRGAYDRAISLSNAVSPDGGYGAEALLTKAWSQYKADQLAEAGTTFSAFATKYPQLPERDETRLMAAQVLLQLGRTEEAGRLFRQVADSAVAESNILQSGAQSMATRAAQALVQARAAGVLFLNDPSQGKAVALQDDAGAGRDALVAVVSDAVPSASADPSARLISLGDVRARLNGVDGLETPASQRLVLAPSSATNTRVLYASRSQDLYAADLAVASARESLGRELESYRMRIALLDALQRQLGTQHDSLARLSAQLTGTERQFADLMARLDAAGVRMKTMLQQQVMYTQQAADENSRILDSLRTAFSASMTPQSRAVLDLDAATIAMQRQTAQLIASRLDTTIARHPVFALRDSVRNRNTKVQDLLGSTNGELASAEDLVRAEVERLRSGEPDGVRRMRSAVADAQTRRTTAEGQLVAAVQAELQARSTEMVAELRRDTEAAEFGTASASFFQALDQSGAGERGTTGSTGTPGRGSAGSASLAAVPSPNKQ